MTDCVEAKLSGKRMAVKSREGYSIRVASISAEKLTHDAIGRRGATVISEQREANYDITIIVTNKSRGNVDILSQYLRYSQPFVHGLILRGKHEGCLPS